MSTMEVGCKVPDMAFQCTDPNITRFDDLKGRNIVLYFYPKDNTPGCTRESKDFEQHKEAFLEHNTVVIGVSRDTLVCHEKFKNKQALNFPLISDSDEMLCRYFNVIIQKNMFKRLILGIERSTFFVDDNGIVQHIWRNVRVANHINNVLSFVRNYTKK